MSDFVVLPPGCRFTPQYPITLADLVLFADAAAELDALNGFVAARGDAPIEEVARVKDMVERMHDAIERVAGTDAGEIYAPDDGSTEDKS